MKPYRIAFYVLALSIIWLSCGKDDIKPNVSIVTPTANTAFVVNDVLELEFIVSDNEALDRAIITLDYFEGNTSSVDMKLEGTSQNVTETFTLNGMQSGPLTITIEVLDEAGNTNSISIQYDYTFFETGSLDINMRLEYNGEPMVIFTDYEYPDGKKIDFTRVSFYTSEMNLDDTQINEVEFHNLTNSHSSEALAIEGYDWQLNNVPVGTYNELSFNIGVQPELNSKDPGEFASGHPLAKPAENWFSWMSYIFLKIEGNIDLDGDGMNETGIALHTGADEALRRINMDHPIEVIDGQSTDVTIIFDVYRLLEGKDRIFPIEEYPQIHSLTQLDGVIELSDNLEIAIHN